MNLNIVSTEYQGRYTGRVIEKTLYRLESFSSRTASILLLLLVGVLAFSVLARDVIHTSVPWLEEICTLICIYMVGLASISAWIGNKHIAVDILPRVIPDHLKGYLKFVITCIEICFLVMAAIGCWKMMGKSSANQTTALAISFSYYYAGVFVCFFGMLLVSLSKVISRV